MTPLFSSQCVGRSRVNVGTVSNVDRSPKRPVFKQLEEPGGAIQTEGELENSMEEGPHALRQQLELLHHLVKPSCHSLSCVFGMISDFLCNRHVNSPKLFSLHIDLKPSGPFPASCTTEKTS